MKYPLIVEAVDFTGSRDTKVEVDKKQDLINISILLNKPIFLFKEGIIFKRSSFVVFDFDRAYIYTEEKENVKEKK